MIFLKEHLLVRQKSSTQTRITHVKVNKVGFIFSRPMFLFLILANMKQHHQVRCPSRMLNKMKTSTTTTYNSLDSGDR